MIIFNRVALLVTTFFCVAPNAFCDIVGPDSPTDQSSGLEEIVVTAQRRSENLERTPVAVSVLSADALTEENITTETDLRTTVSGLGVRSSVSSNQLNYTLRGQSLDAFSNNRPGVLPYFNEIQVGGAGAASAFYDLQSVQVLKGPQGTLFGRNATGGAVLFTTATPTNDFGGYASVLGGNYATQQYEGAINIPIVPNDVLLRVAGFYQSRNGFQYNTYTDSRIGDLDKYGVRPSLKINFSDELSNTLVIDFAHYTGGGTAPILYNLNSLIGALPITGLYAGGATSDAYFGGLLGGVNLTGAWAAYVAAHPRTDPNGISAFLGVQRAAGPFTVNIEGPDNNATINTIVSNATSYTLAPDLQLKNIFGYTHLQSNVENTTTGSPYPIGDEYNNNFTMQTSDELQLLGEAIGKRLTYVVGTYFSNESTTTYLSTDLLGLPPTFAGLVQHNDWEARNKTAALYGQGTYDLSDATGLPGFGITAGTRYTNEKVSSELLPSDSSYAHVIANPLTESVFQEKTFSNVGWTLGLQEQATPDLLIYLASRRSYRNGGFNGTLEPVVGTGSEGGNRYLTETVTDVELGSKFQGRIAEMPTRINIAVYNDWIENAQHVAYTLGALGSPAAISINVPRARVTGLEFDGQINPLAWLKVGVTYNLTDAAFTDNQVSILGRPPIAFATYPDTPRSSSSLYSDVTVPVSSKLAITMHGDVYTQTHIAYSSTANINTGAFLPAFAIADFRIGLDSQDGWSVIANVKNALNRVYYSGGVAVAELEQYNTAVPGDPRTYTLQLRYNFSRLRICKCNWPATFDLVHTRHWFAIIRRFKRPPSQLRSPPNQSVP